MKLDENDIEEELDLDTESSSLSSLEIDEIHKAFGSAPEKINEELIEFPLSDVYTDILSVITSEIDEYAINNKIMPDDIKESMYKIIALCRETLEQVRDNNLDDSDQVEKINNWINTLSQMRSIIVVDRINMYSGVITNIKIILKFLLK